MEGRNSALVGLMFDNDDSIHEMDSSDEEDDEQLPNQ